MAALEGGLYCCGCEYEQLVLKSALKMEAGEHDVADNLVVFVYSYQLKLRDVVFAGADLLYECAHQTALFGTFVFAEHLLDQVE